MARSNVALFDPGCVARPEASERAFMVWRSYEQQNLRWRWHLVGPLVAEFHDDGHVKFGIGVFTQDSTTTVLRYFAKQTGIPPVGFAKSEESSSFCPTTPVAWVSLPRRSARLWTSSRRLSRSSARHYPLIDITVASPALLPRRRNPVLGVVYHEMHRDKK